MGFQCQLEAQGGKEPPERKPGAKVGDELELNVQESSTCTVLLQGAEGTLCIVTHKAAEQQG